MLKTIRSCLVPFALFVAAATFAQAREPAALPDTPVGRQMQALLDSLVSGEYEDYIKQNFSETFLQQFSLAQHLGFFHQMSMMHGGFKVHTIEAATDHKMTILAASIRRSGEFNRLLLETDPQPPHKVSMLGVEMAAPPPGAGAPEKKSMSEAEVLAFVESELGRMAAADEFSGAVLIARDGKPLFKKAYGLASKRFEVPNKVDTKFNLGSINKSFTGLAIAQLLERGLIELDAPIGRYLTDFPEEIAGKITIRHLLTMQSGMGNYWNGRYQATWSTIRTVDDLMGIIRELTLDFEPGTRTQYSNSGYVTLGAIIERVTGQSYYDYVRERIFEPAGMADTDSYELDQIVPNLAIGYTRNRAVRPYQDNEWQNNLFLHSVKGGPAGGGYSTLDDLLRYVEALKADKLAGPQYTNMVMGLFRNLDHSEERPPSFGMVGGAPGINAFVGGFVEPAYTVIVLSNYDPPAAEQFGSAVMDLLRASLEANDIARHAADGAGEVALSSR